MANCTRCSYSISSAGGNPHSSLMNSLAYWVPPKRVSSQSPMPPSSITLRPRVLEGNGHRLAGLQRPHDAQHRRGINAFAQSFVVQADVAAGNGSVEEAAGFRDPFDRLHQLRHDLGPLGIAEIQAIRRRHRPRAHGGKIAAALRHRQFRAFARREVAIAAVAVERHRDRRAGLLNAQDGGVGALRPGHGIGAHLVVVLLPDPALGADVGRGEHRRQGALQLGGGIVGDQAARAADAVYGRL